MRKFLHKLPEVAGVIVGIGLVGWLVSQMPHRPSYINPAYGQSTAPGPNVTPLTIGTGATMAAVPANPVVRALCVYNGNATAANVITLTFGTITPVDGTTGVVIPGGQTVASNWCAPNFGQPWSMLAMNLIAHVASEPVTVFQW